MKTAFYIILIPLLLEALPLQAQQTVYVTTQKGGRKECLLLGRTGKNLRLQLKNSEGGEFPIAIADIKTIYFVLPNTMNNAFKAYQQGQWDKSAAIAGPIVTPLLSYLDLPENNLLPIVRTYGEVLRNAGKIPEALKLYTALSSAPPPTGLEGKLWMAYCLACQSKPEDAFRILEDLPVMDQKHDLFQLRCLVEGRIFLARKEYNTAIDILSQATAFSRIESELYPECLVVLKDSYQAEGERQVEEARKLFQKTPDKKEPAINPQTNACIIVSGKILSQITKNFPDSPWAKKLKPSAPAAPPPPAKKEGETEEKTKDPS